MDSLEKQAKDLGLIADTTPEEYLEALGEAVFFDMACDWLGYNVFLTNLDFVDYYRTSAQEAEVVVTLHEIGKTSKKVKFKVQVEV